MSIRIVAADDQEIVREGLSALLAGSDIEIAALASTGAEAVRLTFELNPQVVLLDVRMPDGSGFAFTTDIRNRGDTVPILILTARDAVEDRVDGLNRGADDYMVQPFAKASSVISAGGSATPMFASTSSAVWWMRCMSRSPSGLKAPPLRPACTGDCGGPDWRSLRRADRPPPRRRGAPPLSPATIA